MSVNKSEILKEKYEVSGSDMAWKIPLFFYDGRRWMDLEVSKKLHDKYFEAQNKSK